MKLTARQVEASKPKDKPYKLADGGGLYLLVNPNGARYWRLKYRIAGKEKLLALGVYPAVSLAEARTKRNDAKKSISDGSDPIEEKKAEKTARAFAVNNSFEAIATEWYEYKCPNWSEGYANNIWAYLTQDIFPYVGSRAVTDIKPTDMLTVLRKMEQRGVLDKLKIARQACRQVFTYAVITERAEHNPGTDLTSALQPPKKTPLPHLNIDQIGDFLQALKGYKGGDIVRLATHILMLTGVRTVELREAEWSEFDLDKGIWQIPSERMKMRRPHIVPLSYQVKNCLIELHTLTGKGRYVFPGRINKNSPMGKSAINHAIKRLGYDGEATGHGFRHTMSTILHDQNYNTEWIERQLAHVDKNSIRGTYNHAQYLDGRREMLQWYADYMDALENGDNVVHGKFGRQA
jgi:integrase